MTYVTTGRACVALALMGLLSSAASAQKIDLEKLGKEALKTLAVGAVVDANAGAINRFINTVTARQGWKDTQATKVVPVLTLGEKGYVGAAQVAGPVSALNSVKAVWQLEGEETLGDGIYRIKVLVPSGSLSPLKIRRVQKVGVTALIDTATGGAAPEGAGAKGLRGGDALKAVAIAAAVKATAGPLNKAVNTLTGNQPALSTRIVPAASLGERAFIGAGQLTGQKKSMAKVNAVWIYDDAFDKGRYRIRILLPTTGSDPTRLKRVAGVGLTALIDATIARVERPAAPTPRPTPKAKRSSRVSSSTRPDTARRTPPGLAKKGGIPPGQAKGQSKGRDQDDD